MKTSSPPAGILAGFVCLAWLHVAVATVLHGAYMQDTSLRSHDGLDVNQSVAAFVPPEDDIVFRPNMGGGPEVIKFGMHCRALSDINIKRGDFFADMVVTLVWTDLRAGRIPVQAQVDAVTLSIDSARQNIWLPDVVVSNRAAKNYEVVSSWIRIETSGVVTKIDRVLATIRNIYDVHAFPFDHQTLIIQLGSSSMMLSELVFAPITDNGNFTGTKDDLLSNSDFSFVSSKALVREEMAASLKKSRAEFIISAKRRSLAYIQNLIVPELLVLSISFSVFWFPMLAAFAMPRVATALVSFLALTTLGLRTNSMLPIRGGLSWIDLFETCCQTLMFFTVGLNIFVLVVDHSFGARALADQINHELKAFFPGMAVIVFGICFCKTDGLMLGLMSIVVNNLLFLIIVIYVVWCWFRVKHYLEDKLLEDEKASQAASAGQ